MILVIILLYAWVTHTKTAQKSDMITAGFQAPPSAQILPKFVWKENWTHNILLKS
jgi:hypothetical protein